MLLPPTRNASRAHCLATLFGCLVLALLLFASIPSATILAAPRPRENVSGARPDYLGVSDFRTKIAPNKRVKVLWKTGSGIEIVGFHVWRRTGRGKAGQISTSLILARHPGMVMGGKYIFRDPSAVPGKTYFYRLEVVNSQGISFWTEEIKVKVK